MKRKPSEASTEVTESQDDSRGEDLSDEPLQTPAGSASVEVMGRKALKPGAKEFPGHGARRRRGRPHSRRGRVTSDREAPRGEAGWQAKALCFLRAKECSRAHQCERCLQLLGPAPWRHTPAL